MFDKKLLFADMYKMLMNDKKELEKVLKEVVKLQELLIVANKEANELNKQLNRMINDFQEEEETKTILS